MAWTSGEYITANRLNEENRSKRINFGTTENFHTYYKPSTSGFYYHGSKGLFFDYTVGWGVAVRAYMAVEKLINGSWTQVYIKRCPSDFTDWGDSVYMENLGNGGEGWYRIMFVTSTTGSSWWGIYPYKQDCQRGDYLVYYDEYTNSGNRIPNTPLSVNNLNSGRVGTIHNL